MAYLCEAFHCMPSDLRREDFVELTCVAHGIYKIREKLDSVRQAFGGSK
jgi:hypothetical protein